MLSAALKTVLSDRLLASPLIVDRKDRRAGAVGADRHAWLPCAPLAPSSSTSLLPLAHPAWQHRVIPLSGRLASAGWSRRRPIAPWRHGARLVRFSCWCRDWPGHRRRHRFDVEDQRRGGAGAEAQREA